MLLPSRVPGYKNSDIKLLPSSMTIRGIWELYIQSASSGLLKSVVYSTFTQLWRQHLPHILVMKPMRDICWICQQNSAAIARSTNKPEEEKPAVSSLIIIIIIIIIIIPLIILIFVFADYPSSRAAFAGSYHREVGITKIHWKRQMHPLLLKSQ